MNTTVYVQPKMKEIEIDSEGIICQSGPSIRSFNLDSQNDLGEEIEC